MQEATLTLHKQIYKVIGLFALSQSTQPAQNPKGEALRALSDTSGDSLFCDSATFLNRLNSLKMINLPKTYNPP